MAWLVWDGLDGTYVDRILCAQDGALRANEEPGCTSRVELVCSRPIWEDLVLSFCFLSRRQWLLLLLLSTFIFTYLLSVRLLLIALPFFFSTTQITNDTIYSFYCSWRFAVQLLPVFPMVCDLELVRYMHSYIISLPHSWSVRYFN